LPKTREKEAMQYKTITLALLEAHPALLLTTDRLAIDLKTSHHSWMDRLRIGNRPGTPEQIASEALELAIEEIRNRLQHEFMPNEEEA
jgi:hypothetical protein